MATASDMIRRALRMLRVIDANEALPAQDAQDALATLNAMLAEFHEAKIGLPDYQLDELTTELASDDADREAVAYQLARRLGGEYGAALLPDDQRLAVETLYRMRQRYLPPSAVMQSVYF